MSDTTKMPTMPSARARATEKVIDQAGFDVEMFHAMDRRDNKLISDELMLGAGSSAFVYSFPMEGKTVAGISVIGARHIAATYGGIKHRFVTSSQKIGAMLIHKSYPHGDNPGGVRIEHHMALEAQDDFYECVVEITDIKTGNTLQVEKREFSEEKRRDGSKYARPHYQLIAQSKAFRNGILDIIPQDVVISWKLKQIAIGKGVDITVSVLDEARDALVTWSTANGLQIERSQVEALTMDQLSGLKAAAQRGKAAFVPAAVAAGLMQAALGQEGAAQVADKKAAAKPAAAAKASARGQGPDPRAEPDFGDAPKTQVESNAADGGDPRPEPPHDPETGEVAKESAAAAPTEPAKPATTKPASLF